MGKRVYSSIVAKVVKDAGRCELRGSRRGLEAHHIIPVVCGGDNSEDNLICVCQCCHSRLTPKAMLTRIGIKNVKHNNQKYAFKEALYLKIEELTEKQGCGIETIFNAIEEL